MYKWKKLLVCILGFALLLIPGFLVKKANMHTYDFEDFFYFLITGMVGSVVILMLAFLLPDTGIHTIERALQGLGKKSLTIMFYTTRQFR